LPALAAARIGDRAILRHCLDTQASRTIHDEEFLLRVNLIHQPIAPR
jgi:hypothetical protein